MLSTYFVLHLVLVVQRRVVLLVKLSQGAAGDHELLVISPANRARESGAILHWERGEIHSLTIQWASCRISLEATPRRPQSSTRPGAARLHQSSPGRALCRTRTAGVGDVADTHESVRIETPYTHVPVTLCQ